MKKLLYLAVLTMVLTACGDSSKESPNNPSETKGMPFYDAYDNYVGIQVNDSMIEMDESYQEILDANLEIYGYEKVPQSEALPGDMIILSDQYNHPHHATMYDSVATSPGVDAYGNTINVGDTLVNYANGSTRYKKGVPLNVFLGPHANGDFTGKHTYIRFTGKKKAK